MVDVGMEVVLTRNVDAPGIGTADSSFSAACALGASSSAMARAYEELEMLSGPLGGGRCHGAIADGVDEGLLGEIDCGLGGNQEGAHVMGRQADDSCLDSSAGLSLEPGSSGLGWLVEGGGSQVENDATRSRYSASTGGGSRSAPMDEEAGVVSCSALENGESVSAGTSVSEDESDSSPGSAESAEHGEDGWTPAELAVLAESVANAAGGERRRRVLVQRLCARLPGRRYEEVRRKVAALRGCARVHIMLGERRTPAGRGVPWSEG
jgi:hypothetical protein